MGESKVSGGVVPGDPGNVSPVSLGVPEIDAGSRGSRYPGTSWPGGSGDHYNLITVLSRLAEIDTWVISP